MGIQASTLRQIAVRLNGTYHDGNQKHLSSELLSQLAVIPRKTAFEQLTRREYALLACGLGGTVLALLPMLLHYRGTRWRPGIHAASRKQGQIRRKSVSELVTSRPG
jgi:Ca-activated chloride channel homolog